MIIEYVDRKSEKEQRKLTSSGESENSPRKGGEGWDRAFWVEKTAFTNTVREQQA